MRAVRFHQLALATRVLYLNSCELAGNRALRQGGALYSKTRGSLLIYNSQFLMNAVRINIEVHVDVVVHVFTGSSEFECAFCDVHRVILNLMCAVPGGFGAKSLVVWKLDGQEPSHEDG